VIHAQGLRKRYGDVVAVDDLTFEIKPGIVTGFLGPNGSGKSTTMRMIVGLDAPTSGSVSVNGMRYAGHSAPIHEVGALLEAKAIHPGRTARNHLLCIAATTGIPATRVDEVLGLVGLSDVASKRTKGFSLGMGQRLGIAAALLGDPATIILDEPTNGLDPEGILWVRHLLRGLAGEGRTVLVSSHLMAEMALTADHLIIIGKGKMMTDISVADFTQQAARDLVHVRTADPQRLTTLLAGPRAQITAVGPGRLDIAGLTCEAIGDIAAANGLSIYELIPHQASLEEAFMDMTRDAVEYRTTTTGVAA
jgi:ABC-2 type transport system ATP-binding protein